MNELSTPKQVGLYDHLFGAGMALLYVVVLLLTANDIGMSRDESFYVSASDGYGSWYEQLYHDSASALTRQSIDQKWSYNNEHPALIKTFFAWSMLFDRKVYPALREGLGLTPEPLFDSPSIAYRLPGMVCGALTIWLIYVFGVRAAGRRLGTFAALSFALIPRIFYHSHLDCFDIPIVLMLTWTIYCYWRSLARPLWAIWCGVAYGCALATKHNAWVLPGILLIHFCWAAAHEIARRKRGEQRKLPLTPWWLLAMVAFGPAIFVATWPYIWFDTLQRINWYVSFHLHHDYYNIAYMGVTWFRPPFPISYPFVMTAITLPLTLTALILMGVGLRLRAILPNWLTKRVWSRGQLEPDARCTDLLWFGCALAPIFIIALPSTPIFGGTKHWFPAYPFLCLFAGYAALHVMVAAESKLLSRGVSNPGRFSLACLGVLLMPGLFETAHSHPFGLSHYTLLAGGAPGAADLGMNRQFWGFTTRSVVDFLKEKLPDGGSVFIHDTTWVAFEMLKRDGHLPPNIHVANSLSEADYALVHFEDHMVETDFQAWVLFGSVQPAHVLTYDGVPIITIYEHPRRRAAR